MTLYVDNKKSFMFLKEEAHDMLNTGIKYHSAKNKKIVIYKVLRCAGDNMHKQIGRSNIELDVIATCFEGKKLYYCSPHTFEYKFLKHAAPAKLSQFMYVHFTSADMEITFEPDSICIVDPDCSYPLILHLIKRTKQCKHLIFFIYETNISLLNILEKQ